MCRLLGFVVDGPHTAREVLGERDFAEFTSLSRVHCDGWGVAGVNGVGLVTRSSALPADTDREYGESTGTLRTSAGFVHLRWATDGLAVAPQNSHPFSDGEIALAHNGSIAPLDRLEGLLSPEGRAALRGDTDSERYFQFVRDRIRARADEAAGVVDAIDTLATEFPLASLNAMVLSASALYVVHVSSLAVPPEDDFRTMSAQGEPIPRDHLDGYFRMSYRHQGSGWAVVSSGLPAAGWTPVRPDSVVRIGRADGRFEYLR
ncbi:class II glutamine amidotransferase [Propionicicella superfundia]|uniref:class II glutamine amidotransferase n=1 Tax=Propionicicella superfundia TaxID=348582 RepID=UPI00146DF4D7|nr:class II glutamine amidotransferase [Propionicicella superfundia]